MKKLFVVLLLASTTVGCAGLHIEHNRGHLPKVKMKIPMGDLHFRTKSDFVEIKWEVKINSSFSPIDNNTKRK